MELNTNSLNNLNFGFGFKTSAIQKFYTKSCSMQNAAAKSGCLEKIPNSDCFTKTLSSANTHRGLFAPNPAIKSFKQRKEKLQIADYLALSNEDRLAIRQKAKKRHIKAANININLGLNLKDNLDKMYGKDGYVFVSIGTSPSLIAKVMEYSGVEVKYLPISDFGGRNSYSLDEICKRCDMGQYLDFVSSQGINPDSVLKSNKKFIFYDYTDTGATLRKFRELMVDKMGLDETKIEFRSINQDLEQTAADKNAVKDYISDYLYNAYAADHSSVSHLPYSWIGRVEITPQNFSAHSKKDAKFFNFLIMDELNKGGLLTQNPNNGSIL